MTDRQLRKIKITPDLKVEVSFIERVIIAPKDGMAEDSKQVMNEYLVVCKHKPHADLTNALLKLRKHAFDLCELNVESKDLSNYTVASLVISGDQVLRQSRALITLSKWIKRVNKAVHIVCPQTIMYEDSEYEKASEMTKQIEAVINEVWQYLNGKNDDAVQLAFAFDQPSGKVVELHKKPKAQKQEAVV